MIDRYSITAPASKIQERFQSDVLSTYVPRYNAAPTQLLPIITQTAPQGISTFYWGAPPTWSKNKALSEKIINVSADVIMEKPALRKAMMKTRCLLPADGFYAWKKVGKKTAIPYRFVTSDQELFSIAGLWEEFEDNEGNELHTFRMVTTTANEIVSSVQDRMPVILTPSGEKIWMNNESSESDVLQVLLPYGTQMTYYPVSPRIHDSETNSPSLILPTPPADQFGNLTLFD